MKNVLIVSASPRLKGNSNALCDEFRRGAEEVGHTVEKLSVSRMSIAGCLGCNACKRNGGTCVQKDDEEIIQEKMLASDVIVLASPIYFYSMAAQLKLALDRTYAFYPKLAGKTFYFLISCAAPDESYVETMLASLRGFTCCVPDSVEGGYVVATGVSDVGDIRNSDVLKKAYELGRMI